MRALLIEDEVTLCDGIVAILNKYKIMVDVAYEGTKGIKLSRCKKYDVIVVDRILPMVDGVEILKKLRSEGINTPIILLDSKHSTERLDGLDVDVNELVLKPFIVETLLPKIREYLNNRDSLRTSMVSYGSLYFDAVMCEISDGVNEIKLTTKEAQLLEFFLANRWIVLGKKQILDRVWGIELEKDVVENRVEIYISRLRKKIRQLDCGLWIYTIRGVGYCLKDRILDKDDKDI